MLTQRGATPVFRPLLVPSMGSQLRRYPIATSILMESLEQQQFITQQQEEGAVVGEPAAETPDGLLCCAPEVLKNPREAEHVLRESLERRRALPPVTSFRIIVADSTPSTREMHSGVNGEAVDGDPATDAPPLNALFNGGSMPWKESYPPHLGHLLRAEMTREAFKLDKGRRNQKRRQAPPQVGQWLNTVFERTTQRGIIVRKGNACFHVDFRYMSFAEDGSAIRFKRGDQVRVRVLSLDRQYGLPQATMLGKMLRPVRTLVAADRPKGPVGEHAIEVPFSLEDDVKSKAHEAFPEALSQEQAAEAPGCEPLKSGEVHQPSAGKPEETEAEAEPVD